jgi:hypothetical protein
MRWISVLPVNSARADEAVGLIASVLDGEIARRDLGALGRGARPGIFDRDRSGLGFCRVGHSRRENHAEHGKYSGNEAAISLSEIHEELPLTLSHSASE